MTKINELLDRIRYNTHDLGEFGVVIRLKYIENFVKDLFPELDAGPEECHRCEPEDVCSHKDKNVDSTKPIERMAKLSLLYKDDLALLLAMKEKTNELVHDRNEHLGL
jgi:hypothetical protein